MGYLGIPRWYVFCQGIRCCARQAHENRDSFHPFYLPYPMSHFPATVRKPGRSTLNLLTDNLFSINEDKTREAEIEAYALIQSISAADLDSSRRAWCPTTRQAKAAIGVASGRIEEPSARVAYARARGCKLFTHLMSHLCILSPSPLLIFTLKIVCVI